MQARVQGAWIVTGFLVLAVIAGCDAAGSKAGGESKQDARDVDKAMDKVLDDFKSN